MPLHFRKPGRRPAPWRPPAVPPPALGPNPWPTANRAFLFDASEAALVTLDTSSRVSAIGEAAGLAGRGFAQDTAAARPPLAALYGRNLLDFSDLTRPGCPRSRSCGGCGR